MLFYEKDTIMKSRQANETIKGYFYQFNKTIFEIISQNNDETKIIIEGIEDVDLETDDTYTAIQCKYYSTQTYNHSVIKKTIICMFNHFLNNKSSNLKYKIYANFKDGQSKLPNPIQLEFFKDNFLTYKEKDVIHKVYEELNLNDNEIKVFMGKLDIDINAIDYDSLEIDIKKLLKQELNITDDFIDLYFIKAGSIIKNIAIKENEDERMITKKQFIDLLTDINIILDKWYITKIGKEKYYSLIRKKYFSEHNISPYERFFIIECPENIQIPTLRKITNAISNKWSKLSKRTPKPFCPYIVFVNLSEDNLLLLKQSLYNDNFKFIDGYDFKGSSFSAESIIKEANYKNSIKVKILDLEEVDNVLCILRNTKEIYQFYINNKVYENKENNQIDIKIDDLEDVLNIV